LPTIIDQNRPLLTNGDKPSNWQSTIDRRIRQIWGNGNGAGCVARREGVDADQFSVGTFSTRSITTTLTVAFFG
jgi:hypothetical protein